MRRRTLVMFVIATLAVGLGWQATASAGGGYGNDPGHKPYGPHAPYITTSSSTVDPGDSITINCRNFAPRELVVFKVDGVVIGKTYTDRRGSCSIRATVPKNTTPGTYTIVATGKTGDSASTQITVKKPHHNKYRFQRYRPPAHHWWNFFF
jgi:hypothetical protein